MRNSSQSNANVCHTANATLNIEEIVKEHGQYIKQFIYRKLWDKQNAEDIFQTVILEAIRSTHTFKAECHPKYWLMGIASNVIKNMAKKLPPITCSIDESDSSFLDDLMEESAEDPATTYERDQLLESLQTAFSSLPEDMKLVIVEVINNGNSYMDAAKKLNIAIGTVRSRISRARELMRLQMNYSDLSPARS